MSLSLGVLGLIAIAAVACHDATAPQPPPAWLADNGAAQVNQKTAVCHAAGPVGAPKFVEISVNGNALSAHLGENGTAVAGHEGDYLVTARTPCPPPATPPNVRVCKTVDANMPAGRTFAFDVNGESITLAGGGCAARTFRVGTPVTISESATAGTALDAINIAPVGAGSANVAGATATVVAGIDVAQVTFTNRTLLGQLSVCKQIGGVGIVNHPFEFVVSPPGKYYSINPPSEGREYCIEPQPSQYPVGTVVWVREEIPGGGSATGIRLTDITVLPGDRIVAGSLNLSTLSVAVRIGEGTTKVRFLNERPVGYLQVCNVSPAGFTGTTRYTVFAGWADGPFPDLYLPANTCALARYTSQPGPDGFGFPLNYPVGLHEQVPAGLRIAKVTIEPGGAEILPPIPPLLGVTIGTVLSTVTFYNVWSTP